MRRWPLVLVVLMTGCSQPATPVATVTVSPVSTSPAANPSPTATPFPDLPLTTVAFSCRLPFYDQGSSIVDGFINFPVGGAAVDPNAGGGLYFDMAYSKWVPVGRDAVAPDGVHYATVELGDQGVFYIHLVDVATGADRSVRVDSSAFGAQPIVFDYAAEGIYLVQAFEHIWPGVWLVDPSTGSVRKVADVERPEVIGPGGALWFGDVNAVDPSPFTTRSSAGILPDEVGRFDLKSATQATWMYQPGQSLEIIGVDTFGRTLIQVFHPGPDPNIASTGFVDSTRSELLLGLSSTTQRSIYKGQLVETLGGPIADSHGVWFGSPQGIYLYSEARGLQKVSDQPGYPANGCF